MQFGRGGVLFPKRENGGESFNKAMHEERMKDVIRAQREKLVGINRERGDG